MQVTYIGLNEYFQRCIPRAKEGKYVLIISLIARYSDAEDLYEKLQKDWASLNDLTGDKILFVFSTPGIRKRTSFFRLPGKAAYEGVMCPFVELLDGRGVEDNYGSLEYNYDGYRKIDWKQRHSQTITEFAKNYNLPESKIPCLFLYDLVGDRYKAIPVGESTNIYGMIKKLVDEIAGYRKKRENIEGQLEAYKNIEKYYFLYEELENEAERGDIKQCAAIRQVLREERSYKEVKDDILNPRIKRDLKRIGQWKRQFFICFENDDLDKQRYLKLKNKKLDIENEFNSIWDNLEDIMREKEKKRRRNSKETILQDLLDACVKMQSNSVYYGASENQRNDFIRDLLKMAKYSVTDQTRRGISSVGKCAGEVDILVEEDGLPVAVIEALNLDSLNTSYLDRHIDRVYNYDTIGTMFNIVLSYVNVSDFSKFCDKYFKHIKEYQYPYQLILAADDFRVGDFSYSDIRVMKTVHKRSGRDTVLYHVCMLIR